MTAPLSPPAPIERIEKPNAYWVPNILGFLLCPVTALIGLCFSYAADLAYQECRDKDAENHANHAKMAFGVTLVFGIMLWVGIIRYLTGCCQ